MTGIRKLRQIKKWCRCSALVIRWNMLVNERLICPYCGQRNDLEIDTTETHQDFVADCEVCCRPFHVQAECEPGELLAIRVEPE